MGLQTFSENIQWRRRRDVLRGKSVSRPVGKLGIKQRPEKLDRRWLKDGVNYFQFRLFLRCVHVLENTYFSFFCIFQKYDLVFFVCLERLAKTWSDNVGMKLRRSVLAHLALAR